MAPLPWTINSEIFPTWARSTATSITTGMAPPCQGPSTQRSSPHGPAPLPPPLLQVWPHPARDHQLRDLPHMGPLHCHLHNYRYMAPPCQGPSTQRSSPHWPMDHQPQNIFYIQKGGITRHKVKDDNTSDAPMLHLYT